MVSKGLIDIGPITFYKLCLYLAYSSGFYELGDTAVIKVHSAVSSDYHVLQLNVISFEFISYMSSLNTAL